MSEQSNYKSLLWKDRPFAQSLQVIGFNQMFPQSSSCRHEKYQGST